jgi:hypothetical protein
VPPLGAAASAFVTKGLVPEYVLQHCRYPRPSSTECLLTTNVVKKANQPYQPNLAAKEAFEEAGLTSEIVPEAVGSFTYEKRLDNCQTVLCKVSVYPFCVTRRLDSWPEQHQWKTRWFALPEAAPVVDEGDLAPETCRA